jgi:predicted MFS family arabinose efflux permease
VEPPTDDVTADPGPPPFDGRRRLAFLAVNGGYLAATCAESLLAPLFPVAARELGLSVGQAGLAFALLASMLATGNIAGGFLLTHVGPKAGATIGLGVAAAGGVWAASSGGALGFYLSQAVIGLGSGAFAASGLSAAGRLARDRRRGLAMGFFGVAFSAGLAIAALLAAIGSVRGWRVSFAASTAISVAAAAAILLVRLPGKPPPAPRRSFLRAWRALGRPLSVGGMAAASQYGTVSFLPTFAVTTWGIAPSTAALILAAARVVSVVAKVGSGHRADRRGALVTAAQLGVVLAASGLWWTLAPSAAVGAGAAIVFISGVSGLGPVGNLLALEAFAARGTMLGLFRSLQIGLGAVAGALIGVCSEAFGLRPTLVVAAVIPIALLVLPRRRSRRPLPDRAAPAERPRPPG